MVALFGFGQIRGGNFKDATASLTDKSHLIAALKLICAINRAKQMFAPLNPI